MNAYHNHKIAHLMGEYFDRLDQIARLEKEATELKQAVLDLAKPGKYQGGTVFKVKKALIEVRAYTRHAYTGIRRSAR